MSVHGDELRIVRQPNPACGRAARCDFAALAVQDHADDRISEHGIGFEAGGERYRATPGGERHEALWDLGDFTVAPDG